MNLSDISVVHLPLMATYVVILLRVRTLPRLVAWLVAVLARHVAWWNVGTALTGSALGKSNRKCLAKPSLGGILLLRGAKLGG